MATVAQILRQVRERRGCSLEEVAQRTHIPSAYLALLEGQPLQGKEARESFLPDPVYLIPHLRHYADFLGLNPNFTVACFADELHAAQKKSRTKPTSEPPTLLLSSLPQRSRAVSFSIVLASVLVTLAFIGQYSDGKDRTSSVIHPEALTLAELPSNATVAPTAIPKDVASRAVETPSQESLTPPTPGLPTVPAAPDAVVSAGATASPEESRVSVAVAAPAESGSSPTASSTQPTTPPPSHLLRIHAKEATWIRVFAEGQTKELILRPGQTASWNSEHAFEVTVGNAGGVSLNLDGQELPPLGKSGQVIRNMHLPSLPTEGQG
jgi:cytoskeleton protein RodZ